MFEDDNEIVQRGRTSGSRSLPFFVIVTLLILGFILFKQQNRSDIRDETTNYSSVAPDYSIEDFDKPIDPHNGYKKSIILDAPPMPEVASTFTIEDAYASVPKTRTPFLASRSSIEYEEASYLQELFEMTDIAVRARVMLQISLYEGKELMSFDEYRNDMRPVYAFFEQTVPPKRLKSVSSQISQALQNQLVFFDEWRVYTTPENRRRYGQKMSSNSVVKKSSRGLISAYNELMQLYSDENTYIKGSFYNHLCALDFI